MPTLNAPSQVVFLISLTLVAFAVISYLGDVPYIGHHPSILMTLAYVVLATGCVMKGV